MSYHSPNILIFTFYEQCIIVWLPTFEERFSLFHSHFQTAIHTISEVYIHPLTHFMCKYSHLIQILYPSSQARTGRENLKKLPLEEAELELKLNENFTFQPTANFYTKQKPSLGSTVCILFTPTIRELQETGNHSTYSR